MDVIDWNYEDKEEQTFFHAIFKMAAVIDQKIKIMNPNLRHEIEKVYFRFTKYVENNSQIDVNGILGHKDITGQTVFIHASTDSEKIAKDILLRNVNVN